MGWGRSSDQRVHGRLIVSPIRAAYLAGLCDGEGYIGISKTKTLNYYLRIAIKMTHEPVVRSIWYDFGGSFFPWKGEDKTIWTWSVSGKRAGEVAQIILPYSIVKRPEIEKSLLFLSVIDNLSILEKEQFRLELQQLKRYEFLGFDKETEELDIDIKFDEAIEE